MDEVVIGVFVGRYVGDNEMIVGEYVGSEVNITGDEVVIVGTNVGDTVGDNVKTGIPSQ
eukprot:CAMPEP_0114666032 /NCGR_PEP_ID=MMETSP0191-20121206/31866_1 /TAXON_ID=126664 /ORGANISM="Sorites sp." /LENGTH=58 /DNA_ID=CAMNT_0001912697 /DNA_START=57 /DNA_END=233 /DNA_ORIENTATION=-